LSSGVLMVPVVSSAVIWLVCRVPHKMATGAGGDRVVVFEGRGHERQ
jgi:hypothetical protein